MDINVETPMNAPAEAVWDVWARQFANIAEWASVVEESRAIARDDFPPDVRVDDRGPVVGRQFDIRSLRTRRLPLWTCWPTTWPEPVPSRR